MHTDLILACSPQASKTIGIGHTALYSEVAADQLSIRAFQCRMVEIFETWPSTLPFGVGRILV